MKADPTFSNMPRSFWASVRSLSQKIGYTVKGASQVRVPTVAEIKSAFIALGLDSAHVVRDGEKPTSLAIDLTNYFAYRADVLNKFVEPRLMDAARAKLVYDDLKSQLSPKCPVPFNKQKGKKKAPAYFTGIVNMLIEGSAGGLPCNFDPRELTTVTRDGAPLRTLARRIDGAFPSAVNPVAVWEIKEYYYTTTFGSRVADGVYESLLDGMELQELREHEKVKVLHYLMLDARYTWWECGKSYLCRIVDMLNMGYTDEVFFGYEVVERLPDVVKEWVKLAGPQSKLVTPLLP